MVVVVAGEILGELEASVLVVGDDAVHDCGLLEDDEVAVDAALGESTPGIQDLGDGERSCRIAQHVDQRGAVARHALVDLS